MKKCLLLAVVLSGAALVSAVSSAQEKKKESANPQGQEMPVPKPGPEHQILKMDVGVWDATIESMMEPGGKPNVAKGVESREQAWRLAELGCRYGQGFFFSKPLGASGMLAVLRQGTLRG